MSYLKDHPIKEQWFQEKVTNETVVYAESFAEHLAEESEEKNDILPLTTSQLRKFFGAVKSLQMDITVHGYKESEVVMLKPKLAYAVGRVKQKNKYYKERRIEDFAEVLSSAIDMVNSSKTKDVAFRNFISFFEAIVAYHKRYGKEN